LDFFFLRHAKAVSRTDWDRADSERPLTERGRKEAGGVAAFIAELGFSLDSIVTSPYARAFETADIVARHLKLRDRLITDDRVAPGFDREQLEEILHDYPDVGAIMFVGHEPDFSMVVEELVGGRVTMKKGGLAYVESAQPSLDKATLVWLVQPSVLGI
jgi:phosphohistidine phosphatase